MAGYIGQIGQRIEAVVTVKSIYKYQTHFGWQTQDCSIYTMTDEEGHTLVWKTSGCLAYNSKWTNDGKYLGYIIQRGDKISIKATVKAHGEYKEEEQTELQRVKVLEVIEKSISKEEWQENKRKEQVQSLNDGDFIWKGMKYRQYKKHYADCETVAGSYDDGGGHYEATIDVIIRNGRLKASGVRGKFYRGYQMQNESGEMVTYRAVSEENALRRANKEYPDHEWECVKIYDYMRFGEL